MINVYDFFCGCGGASKGFQDANLEIVLGIDNDPDAASTFKRNFPRASFIENDIRNIKCSEIKKFINPFQKMLFCACAPCQPFSKQNSAKKSDDKRINLLSEFNRFIKYYHPDFIFVENVPGLQKIGSTEGPLNLFLKSIMLEGYSNYEVKILSAADYGVPQQRKRLIILAAKDYIVKFPQPTHGGNVPYSTIKEWIDGLPPLKAGETSLDDPDHSAANLSTRNLKRIRCIPEGGSRTDLPYSLRLKCHHGHKGHTDVYGRLSMNMPSSTLTTKCIILSNGRFGHPYEDRALSVREAACIQTFPRNFSFSGKLMSKARQIGNAVPPLLTKRIGEYLSTL
jgi:DNA (cytosine-5)-methyltransferase 1